MAGGRKSDSGGHGANRFWDFSLHVYRQPGVPEACLGLQDRHSIDVNLMLYCAWAGAEAGIDLGPGDLRQLAAGVDDWHDRVVRRLRAVRADLKRQSHGAPAALAASLRERIKAMELEAERIEQDMLFDLSSEVGGARQPGADLCGRNISAYFNLLGVQAGGPDEADIGTIVAAAAAMADVR